MTASRNEREARQCAEAFRAENNLGTQPIRDLISLIERATGHDVAVLNAGENEHGLTVRDPQRDVTFIGVATTPHPMRQRSTLAHELAHVLFGDAELAVGKRPAAEIRADAFARHLLVPQEGVMTLLGERTDVTTAELSEVVQTYLVSPRIAAITLRDAGFVSPQTYSEWATLSTRSLATRFGWSDQYSALAAESQCTRAPRRLLARAINGYIAGVVDAQKIAMLRGVPVATVRADFTAAGITPRRADPTDLPADALPPVEVDLSELDEDDDTT